MNKSKWYTCIPKALSGNESFYNRDAGLFCRAFNEIGVESKTVMPLPCREGELPFTLRTEYRDLESSEWWKSLHLDGVVLYSWGSSKYNEIARAIHHSGTKLLVYLDTSAAVYPWQDWRYGTKLIFRAAQYKRGRCFLVFALAAVLRSHSIGLANYPWRRAHLGYADIIGIPAPSAVDAYNRVPFLLSRQSKKNIRLVPCPIAWHFRYDPAVIKENRIIAVGRWDDEEPKRPRYMMQAIELVCQKDVKVTFDIFGHTPGFMHQWHANLPPRFKARITLHGIVPNQKLAEYYQRAQICLCPSIHEGTHLASAEAVCCGCSIVVAPNTSLKAVQWYASENSGTVAQADTPGSYADAILTELQAWQANLRSPEAISATWCKTLHATETARKILSFFV